MSRYLLDTGIASDYLNRRLGVHERALAEVPAGHAVGIAVPVLAELLHGVEYSATRDRNLELLRTRVRTLRLWPFDRAAAFEYGKIAATQQRAGRPMQTIDMMIAAVAFTLDCVVVTKDSDFAAIPGLRVEDWSA